MNVTDHRTIVEHWRIMGDSGNAYTVAYYDKSGFTCTCPDHVHRLRECKHIRLVIQEDTDKVDVRLETLRMLGEQRNSWMDSLTSDENQEYSGLVYRKRVLTTH